MYHYRNYDKSKKIKNVFQKIIFFFYNLGLTPMHTAAQGDNPKVMVYFK